MNFLTVYTKAGGEVAARNAQEKAIAAIVGAGYNRKQALALLADDAGAKIATDILDGVSMERQIVERPGRFKKVMRKYRKIQ